MQDDPIVIVGSARTPMGGLMGDVAALSATELGSRSIAAALERAGVPADTVDEVFMGNVLPAGLGQAPARQAALGAGLPLSVPCTTVSKVCGSGMRATMFAHDTLALDRGRITVAGGMESMSRAPYLLDKARGGYRLGHGRITDHMFFDGLEDAYEKGELMGRFAERCASHFGFTREAQDDFAETSLQRARKASEDGTFEAEITPITISERKGERTISRDEQPWNADPDKLRTLKPAFDPQGTVTAANASSISDGAAALVLMRRSEADRRGLKPLAAIRGQASHAREPQWFTTAPVGATRNLLEQVGWSAGDVDLYEINEAFAVVVMAAMQELGLSHDTVNVHGGACALGHPIGASGARILVTLLNALERHGLRRGVASICIGGGEATAVAVERLD
ncbi:acetyl-CoA C-acyltransferase [Aquisalimonas lutea]|uniref:acetyl-CoA C-acyltransferase n=1 Tax=Aquisalimonas lutea TaxID=1327750 RepID=UPI0025B2ADF9|nr:acetyl-CoA C-acyltransferase [Aquisalimonas lutea]MDN3518786.1 acetyl-CoA C-acyltransferase [Aquisalimonas lutea]